MLNLILISGMQLFNAGVPTVVCSGTADGYVKGCHYANRCSDTDDYNV